MRHLQTLQYAANLDSLSAIQRNGGQPCRTEDLDITREIAMSRSQDLAHSPTFFGALTPARQYSQPQLSSPERRGGVIPQRSPRLHSLECMDLGPQPQGGVAPVMPDQRGQHCNQWKSEDIASLEHELAQLRFAAEALPSLSNLARTPERPRPAPPSPRTVTNSGGGSPRVITHEVSNAESAWLNTAMRQVELDHHGSGGYSRPMSPRSEVGFNRETSPQFGFTSKASPDFGKSSPSRSPEFGSGSKNDSPNQASEPEVTRTQLELKDALNEVDKLKHALQKANQEIATLREEKKASEAAHSRDVAALATLLQQVTAEKARALAHSGHHKDHHVNANHGTIEKSFSSLTTDDTWSVAESEASSGRDRSFGTLVASLSKHK